MCRSTLIEYLFAQKVPYLKSYPVQNYFSIYLWYETNVSVFLDLSQLDTQYSRCSENMV